MLFDKGTGKVMAATFGKWQVIEVRGLPDEALVVLVAGVNDMGLPAITLGRWHGEGDEVEWSGGFDDEPLGFDPIAWAECNFNQHVGDIPNAENN